MWQYYLVKLISKILCYSPDFLHRLVSAFLGKTFWLVTPKWRKKLAVDQVMTCLMVDEDKALAIARESVEKYGAMIVDVLCFPTLSRDNIEKKVTFSDESKLSALFEQGKGAVLATAHFGNWELHGAALALYGYPIVAVAQKQHNDAMDRFINEYRSMTGEHVVYRSGVFEMAKMLSDGFGIGLLADQDGGRDGVVVDFFNRPTSCPKGPIALARLKGAPIALTLIHRREGLTHEIFVSEPVTVEKTKDREADIEKATKVLMKMLEDEIKKEPEMWFWLHNRWKADKNIYKNMV